ncbi:hypothetical protein ANTPLA_LOCUS11149 [Anthophora plagiata]
MHSVGGSVSHESKKPSHVRRLNFGQSILTLNVVKQFQGQKDGALLINGNVASIPCTEKGDFVRKWIETHNGIVFDAEEAPQSSPVLGLPVSTELTKTSPVFGDRRKRAREKATLNNNAIDNVERTRSNDQVNAAGKQCFHFTAGCNKRMRMDTGTDRKENIRRNLFNSNSDNVPTEMVDATSSPILDHNSSYSFKRKQRKSKGRDSDRKALDRIDNKCMKTKARSPMICTKIRKAKESPVLDRNSLFYEQRRKKLRGRNSVVSDQVENTYRDSNINFTTFSDSEEREHRDTKLQITCSQKRRLFIKEFEDSFVYDRLKSYTSKDSKISEDSVGLDSSGSKTKLNIEDSPKTVKDTARMQIESSNEDEGSRKYVADRNNDTDKDFSDQIEDADTQDAAVPVAETCNRASTRDLFSVSTSASSIRSQTSNKDSDQTFFSKAEQFQCTLPCAQASQRISQTSTQVTNLTNNRSSQSGIIISTETTPRKHGVDSSMRLTAALLDSGKKRKKPRRGSLLEKLQSTVNRQVSFVRIWRHQLKQSVIQNTPVTCVTVYVRACTTRFNRQFLEGIVTQDPHDLLPRKKTKEIKIMTVPDIVGRIEMKSKGLVQIFPPWETLDDEESILNVIYIRVVPENEKNLQHCKVNANRIKEPIVEEFHCACINANKMIPSCDDQFNKPNVMEKLFSESS